MVKAKRKNILERNGIYKLVLEEKMEKRLKSVEKENIVCLQGRGPRTEKFIVRKDGRKITAIFMYPNVFSSSSLAFAWCKEVKGKSTQFIAYWDPRI